MNNHLLLVRTRIKRESKWSFFKRFSLVKFRFKGGSTEATKLLSGETSLISFSLPKRSLKNRITRVYLSVSVFLFLMRGRIFLPLYLSGKAFFLYENLLKVQLQSDGFKQYGKSINFKHARGLQSWLMTTLLVGL